MSINSINDSVRGSVTSFDLKEIVHSKLEVKKVSLNDTPKVDEKDTERSDMATVQPAR